MLVVKLIKPGIGFKLQTVSLCFWIILNLILKLKKMFCCRVLCDSVPVVELTKTFSTVWLLTSYKFPKTSSRFHRSKGGFSLHVWQLQFLFTRKLIELVEGLNLAWEWKSLPLSITAFVLITILLKTVHQTIRNSNLGGIHIATSNTNKMRGIENQYLWTFSAVASLRHFLIFVARLHASVEKRWKRWPRLLTVLRFAWNSMKQRNSLNELCRKRPNSHWILTADRIKKPKLVKNYSIIVDDFKSAIEVTQFSSLHRIMIYGPSKRRCWSK